MSCCLCLNIGKNTRAAFLVKSYTVCEPHATIMESAPTLADALRHARTQAGIKTPNNNTRRAT